MSKLPRSQADENRTNAIDTGLIADLLALAIIAAVTTFGVNLSAAFHFVAASIR